MPDLSPIQMEALATVARGEKPYHHVQTACNKLYHKGLLTFYDWSWHLTEAGRDALAEIEKEDA